GDHPDPGEWHTRGEGLHLHDRRVGERLRLRTMTEPLLELCNATLGYGADAVLEQLDFAVGAGDFIVIGGPNGGGKTTLLRSLAGLIPVLGGTGAMGRG